MTRTQKKLNPCGQCHLSTKDGVDCDSCTQWWCLDCLNKSVRSTCTPILYKKLCELGEFAFKCEECCRYLLPKQLVLAGRYDEQHLIDKYNVNVDAFLYRTDGSHSQQSKSTEKTPMTTPGKEESVQHVQPSQLSEALAEVQQKMHHEMLIELQRFQLEQQRQVKQLMEHQMSRQSAQQQTAVPPEMTVLADTIATAITSAATDTASSRNLRPIANLPKIPLPTFSGEILQWDSFRESFDINIHNVRGVDNRNKMDALRSLLKGPAYDKIAGLGTTGDAYEEAIRILESNYGDKRAQLNAARVAIGSIPAVKADYSNLEKVTDDFRTAASKLSRLGVGTPALDEHANLFFSKLPMKLQLWIDEKRLDQEKFQLPLELTELLKLLQRAKMLFVRETTSLTKRGRQEDMNSSIEVPDLPTPTANFMNAAGNRDGGRRDQQQRQPTQGDRPGQTCAFCTWNQRNVHHRSEDCRAVGNIRDRWTLVKRARLCFKCFETGHPCSKCPVKGNCGHCKGPHHKALCHRQGKENGRGSQLMFSGSEPTGVGQGNGYRANNSFANQHKYPGPMGHGAGSINGYRSGYREECRPGQTSREKACCWTEEPTESNESTTTATGTETTTQQRRKNLAATTGTGVKEDEEPEAIALTTAVKADDLRTTGVVMSTFPAELMNTITGATESTGVFVDQGATYTTMCLELAKKLNLQVLRKTVLTVTRYNSTKELYLNADVVKVTIKTTSGELKDVMVYADKKLAPAIPLQPLYLNAEVMSKLKNLPKILNLPPRYQHKLFHIGIILGNDVWHDLMMGPRVRITRLQSSLYLYETHLGGVLSGCIKKEPVDAESTTMLSITAPEPKELETKFWHLDVLGIGETSAGRGRGSERGAGNLFSGKPNYNRPVKGHEAGRVNGRDVGYNYFHTLDDRVSAGSAKGCAVGYKYKFKRPMGHGAGSVKGLDFGFGYYNWNSLPGLSHKDKSRWDKGSDESIRSATSTAGTGTTATTATVEEKKTNEIVLTSEAKSEKTQMEQTKATANTATAEEENKITEVTKKLVESTKTAPRQDVSHRKWKKKTNSGNLCQGHCLIHCLLLFFLLWKTSIQSKGGLNYRTFTSPSSDVNNGATLSPASFQTPGTQLGGFPLADDDGKDPDFLPTSEKDLLRETKRIESKLNQCWGIFQKSYLQELSEIHVRRDFKKRKKGCDWEPRAGDTTLVMDTTPRATWKLVRVERLLPGPDGAVRFVEIRLPTGQLTTRSVQHLCPLESFEGRHAGERDDEEDVDAGGDGEDAVAEHAQDVQVEAQPTARDLRAQYRALRHV